MQCTAGPGADSLLSIVSAGGYMPLKAVEQAAGAEPVSPEAAASVADQAKLLAAVRSACTLAASGGLRARAHTSLT